MSRMVTEKVLAPPWGKDPRESRWRVAIRPLQAVTVGWCLLCCGCFEWKKPDATDAVGVFRGNLGEAEQELKVMDDSTFEQILTTMDGDRTTNQGTWRIEGHEIVFDDFVKDKDIGAKNIDGSRRRTDNVGAVWIALGSRTNIVFDVDEGYELQKVK